MAGHSAAPLFPRLHVNDTEKQGPKAPPRNKMALYEQFTIPSQSLLHLTPASAPIPYQQQYASNMYQYPYLSYYVPSSSMQPASSNQRLHFYVQPSIETSSIVMSNSSYVLNDNESQRRSNHKIVGDSAHSDAPRSVNNCDDQVSKPKDLPSQRTKTTNISSDTIEILNLAPKNCSLSKKSKSVARTSITETTDCLHEADNSVQVGSSQPKPYVDVGVHLSSGEVSELDQDTTPDEIIVKQRARKAMDHQNEDGPLLVERSREQSVDMDDRSQCESKVESASLIETKDKPGQARLQSRCGHDHDQPSVAVSDCDAVPAQDFRPKHVMRQMGQQQFWKARKALLWQQQVFSDQVFELHKLIRVQKLLAMIPGTLLDEATPFGMMDKDVAPLWNATDCEKIVSEKEDIAMSCKSKQGVEAVAPRVSTQSVCEEAHSLKNADVEAKNIRVQEINNDVHLKSNPQMVGAVSWGYPRMGAEQWMDPHGRPINFWSFPGPLSPGFSCGRFGFPMVGTMPPIMPVGIPVPHHSQETSESRIPCAVSNQNMYSYATHQQLTGPWYYLSQNSSNNKNSLDYNQRLHNIATKEAPEGSQASMNNQLEESMKSTSTTGVELPQPLKVSTDKSKVSERHNSNASTICKGLEQLESTNVQLGVEAGHRMVEKSNDGLNLFPVKQISVIEPAEERRVQVIKVVPRSAGAASRSTAGILLSLQQERQK